MLLTVALLFTRASSITLTSPWGTKSLSSRGILGWARRKTQRQHRRGDSHTRQSRLVNSPWALKIMSWDRTSSQTLQLKHKLSIAYSKWLISVSDNSPSLGTTFKDSRSRPAQDGHAKPIKFPRPLLGSQTKSTLALPSRCRLLFLIRTLRHQSKFKTSRPSSARANGRLKISRTYMSRHARAFTLPLQQALPLAWTIMTQTFCYQSSTTLKKPTISPRWWRTG